LEKEAVKEVKKGKGKILDLIFGKSKSSQGSVTDKLK